MHTQLEIYGGKTGTWVGPNQTKIMSTPLAVTYQNDVDGVLHQTRFNTL